MRGLTLLEVLVSITILCVIMAAVYSAYTSNVEAIQIAHRGQELFQPARIIMDRMSKDLESAFLGSHREAGKIVLGMLAEDIELDGRPADKLNFTALTHLPLTEKGPKTDLCEVGYYLEEGEENDGFILYRRDDGTLDDDITSGGEAYQLASNVESLDITFQDSEGENYNDWNTLEGEMKDRLPSLIGIELRLKDQWGKERTFFTSIHPETSGHNE